MVGYVRRLLSNKYFFCSGAFYIIVELNPIEFVAKLIVKETLPFVWLVFSNSAGRFSREIPGKRKQCVIKKLLIHGAKVNNCLDMDKYFRLARLV